MNKGTLNDSNTFVVKNQFPTKIGDISQGDSKESQVLITYN